MAEAGNGLLNQSGSLSRIGEIGWDEEDIVGGLDRLALKKNRAGRGEFIGVAGSENEFGSGAAIAFSQGETEAARASGNDDHLIFVSVPCLAVEKFAKGGCGHDSGGDLSGVGDGARSFHGTQ